MAEIALPVISALLNKLISLAAGQISLVWGVYDDLQILSGSKGSKVLATTRSDGVASTMQSSESHRLEMLSEDYSWKLVEKIAFAKGGAKKTRQLVDIGRRIIKSCRGVPLALKAIGNLLYSKNGVCDWLKIDRSEIWNSFCTTDDGVLSSIKLSYDNLPSLLLKQSFAYCSIFRKDTILDKDKLVQIWMANGLLYRPKGSDLQMEDVGSNYFDILLQCSLLQDPQKDRYNNITGCKIHDLVHDFSLQVSATYCFNAEDGLEVNEEMEAMHLSLIVNGEKKLKNMKGTPFKARTCYLVNGGLSEDMLINFRYLTVLIMENWNSKDLPNAIVEMKHLRIVGCQNSNFPSWMETKIYLSQLVNLVEIKLDRLEMCEQVPSLGNLPCLQILHMFGLHNVKCIGKEFYGYTCVDSSSNFSSNGEEIFLFPSLKELRLVNMCRLTEWSDAMIPSCSSIKVFPNLKELYLYGLPKLKVLPDLSILTCLQQLEIHHCHSLSCLQNVNRLASLQVLEISNSQTSFWFTDCPNLTLPAKCTRPSEDFKCLEGLLFTLFQKVRLALECLLDRCGF
ncbi:hypothetical protein ACH5RR_031765 [Cinchona calisaya]|uniref:NB-ARC domain-containing protein n=1 Tax=Cinchona calisaya TaxID=153742 RepID=A0ABD2YG61_9GENT